MVLQSTRRVIYEDTMFQLFFRLNRVSVFIVYSITTYSLTYVFTFVDPAISTNCLLLQSQVKDHWCE